MHRSSSRRDLRSERLGQSPYSRKEKSAVKRPVANQTFSPLSSIVSFVSNAFGRGQANDDDKSVSGSEDGWDGEAPESMNGQDVFSLASAAGRGGPAFEERAEAWRAEKGLLTKSARRGFPNSKSNWGMLDLDTEQKIRPSPSMPALPSLRSAEKAPVPGPSSKTHLRPFVTPSANRAQDRVHTQERVPSSASSAALRAFVAAKGTEPFEPQDVEVMDSLMRGVRAEASVPDLRSLGGWSAATYASTPQRNTHATPVRQHHASAVGTPGSAFSLGSNAPLPLRSTPQRKTYLGPGMSPRRIFGRPVPVHKPLFGSMDDTTNKKRRVEDTDAIDIDEPASSSSSAAPSNDSPAAAAAAAFNAKARQSSRSIRPSPLSQLNSSPEREEAVRAGKKRADDLLRSVIDDELGPEEPEKPKLVINPYEETTPSVAAPSGKVVPSRSSLRKSSSSMKLSTRGTGVVRGAAEKIERLKGSSRKLTTLELVSGFKPTPEPTPTPMDEDKAGKAKEVEPVKATPVFASTSKPTPKSPPKSRPALPEPPAFKPFAPPTLSSSTLGSSTSSPKRKSPERTESAAVESIVAASKRSAAAAFNPTPIGLGPAPVATASLAPQRSPAPRTPSKHVDPTHMFLSAKDSALKVEKVSLPFFTFTLPSSATKGGPSDAVKAKVNDVPIEVYDFSMRKPSLPSAFLSPTSPAAKLPTVSDGDAEWTCSLCMLKNPGSAKDKCTICEAPKQPPAKKATPAAPPSSFAFKPAAPAAGEWTCDTCMLKNPASATDKCTICEARKPAAKAAAPAAAVPSVFKPAPAPAGEWTCETCMLKNPASATDKCTVCEARKPGAVAAPPAPAAFKPAPATSGEWTCDTCMLKNPASATDKCTICEAPKPGASASASAAPKPPSAPSAPFGFGSSTTKLPAPPAGGFSFGGKPAAPAAPSGGFSFGGFKPAAAPPAGGFSFGQSPSTPATGGFKPAVGAPPTGGFTFGAAAAPAAAFKPTGGQGEWTCDTCMLKNPDSAKDKCTVCEAARPK